MDCICCIVAVWRSRLHAFYTCQVEILLEHLPSLGQYVRPQAKEQGLTLLKLEEMSRLVFVSKVGLGH